MNGVNEYDKKHQEIFHYKFTSHNISDKYKIEVPIDIPFEGSIIELAHRIINGFNLPLYIIKGNSYIIFFFKYINYILSIELVNELQRFIDKCSIEFYDCQTVDSIDSIKNETIEVEDIVKYWENAFKEVGINFSKVSFYFKYFYQFNFVVIYIFRRHSNLLITKVLVMISCLAQHFTS